MKRLINEIKRMQQLAGISTSKYTSIGPNNLMEAAKMNGFSINKNNDPSAKTIYFDIDEDGEINEIKVSLPTQQSTPTIDYTFDNKGGTIVFSVNVNAVSQSKNKLLNVIKNNIETIKNTLFKSDKINKVLKKHEGVYGVTIGNFVKGRYKAADGTLYDERSMSIEILGITSDVLNNIAKDLADEFKQETVLVKNYENNKIYLVK